MEKRVEEQCVGEGPKKQHEGTAEDTQQEPPVPAQEGAVRGSDVMDVAAQQKGQGQRQVDEQQHQQRFDQLVKEVNESGLDAL